ncbi:sensor histidine kinase [Nonomuraea sp. H19]|uniref:sensor histidine kinase n=1 Tax=Nonomuraea sp. H19 TaxID=3452206 RepID=UPI003F8925A5
MAGDAGFPHRWLARLVPRSHGEARAGGLGALRMARAVTAAVLFGYVVNVSVFVWVGGLRGLGLAGFGLCLAVVFLLQLAHSTGDTLAWTVRTRALTLSAQAVVTFTPFLWVGPQAGTIAGFLAGSMLLAVAGPLRWGLYAAVGGGVLLALWSQVAAVGLLYAVYFTLLTGLMVYGVSSLATLVDMVHAARGELARMAVVQERLRVARDLHDLLGHDLSAMTVKSELAYRLLPGAAERSRQELQDVLAVARRSLADVRVVAGGYRPMSLAAELASAESMLVAAEMRVRVRCSAENLPEGLETVLAVVLREAVTNVLRHSKAQRCEIEAAVDKGRVRLCVGNDGVEPPPSATPCGNGSGLGNLGVRLAAIGGTLAIRIEDGWFRLTAEAPLAGGTAERPPEEAAPPGEVAAQPWHLRVARLITVVVLTGYGLLLVVNVLALEQPVLELAGFAGCVAILVGAQIVLSLRDPRSWPVWARGGTLALQGAVTVLPLLWIGTPWGSIGGFLAGSLLLALAGRRRWALYAAVGLGVLLLSLADGQPVEWSAYLTISTLLTGLVVYGISSLSGLVKQVDQARGELARMAVTRERLRVARDLHELLGHDLSAMTVKSELAVRLLPRFAGRAKAEIADVLDIARRAVAGVRAVASGYRHMSLAAEVDSAVSTLTAAGIDVHVDVPVDAIPDELDAVLAMVLREAVTNVLRHSDGTECRIAAEAAGHEVRLSVSNDGAPPSRLPVLEGGTGLGDLAARLRAIGGRLAAGAGAGEGTFRLVAVASAETLLTRADSRGDQQ